MTRTIRCVIFDLDGVLVHTDQLHFEAWKSIADAEGIPFTSVDNQRLRGVDRMTSLNILLERAAREYSSEEKQALADRKNARYREMLESLSPRDIAPGAKALIEDLRARGVRIAVASSSRNARFIIERLGLAPLLDAIADGADEAASKPRPDLFLLAAKRAGAQPESCLVVEDAIAGIEAAANAGMDIFAVGGAESRARATRSAPDLRGLRAEDLLTGN